jgi:hypothetical protein
MKDTNPTEFSQLLFFMRLVRDHGLVNHLGHGLGEISGSEKRLNVAAQLDLLKKEPLVEINALRGTEMYFRLSRYPDSEQYAVIIEFAHAFQSNGMQFARLDGISFPVFRVAL